MKRTFTALLAILSLFAVIINVSLADELVLPVFLSVTGVVTEVREFKDENDEAVEGWFFITIKDENDAPAMILVTENTCYPFDTMAAVDGAVTAYYYALSPMPLIFPPQYTADVLAVNVPEPQSVKVDRFTRARDRLDGMLVSDDGMLALQIDDATEMITVHGEAFDGELSGYSLAVVYDVSTRSIPAQTTPSTIIVLPAH